MKIHSKMIMYSLLILAYFPAYAKESETYIILLSDADNIAMAHSTENTSVAERADIILKQIPSEGNGGFRTTENQSGLAVVERAYENLNSFSANLSQSQIEQLKKHPKVKGVYKDVTFTADNGFHSSTNNNKPHRNQPIWLC